MNKSQDIENLLLNPQKVPELIAEREAQHSSPAFSVQPKTIVYAPLDCLSAIKFEQDLISILRTRVEKVRLDEPKVAISETRHLPLITKWNDKLSDKINRELFILLESFNYKVQQFSIEGEDFEAYKNQALVDLRNFKSQLSGEIGSGRTLFGLPLKFTSLNPEHIWEEVQATEFFDKFSEDLEFILTAGVFGYPHGFCSVWVFVGFVYGDS